MEFTGRFVKTGAADDEMTITFTLNEKSSIYPELVKIKDISKLKITVQKFREKRSLDANAYLWVMLQKMAESLLTDKWTLYLRMLRTYGQFTYIVAKPAAVEAIKKQWRECEEVGEIEVNGSKAVQMLCYYGSSTYDTIQMSKLIDGVVSECKDLDIETIPPEELRKMKERWGV
jgi:hypothetical protein